MGFKVFIVLLWLSVPCAGALLLRADMQRYERVSAGQRAVVQQRSAELSRRAAALARQARNLRHLRSADELRRWRQEWLGLTRAIERDLPALEAPTLAYCPAAGGMLLDQQAALADIQQQTESAVRDQEYLLRSEQVLLEMAEEQSLLGWYSRQYQYMPGGRGIYLNLQDELAKQETRYQQQSRERSRLQDAIWTQLTAAEQAERQLQEALERTPELLAIDAQQTYEGEMQARWERFDLREELTLLLTRLASSPAPK